MGKTKNINIKIFLPYFFIAVVWFVFSSQYFLKGLIPFPSTYLVSFFPPWNAYYGMPVKNNAMPDVITQIFPWKKLTIESWKNGEAPLWNPYTFSGTHHGGNYQSAVFSPVNILFFLFPFIDAWSLHILLQPLVAGIAMYIFLRSTTASVFSSIIGSISFMFFGFLTVWMAYGTLGWSIAVLPFALMGVVKYSQSSRWRHGIVISLSVCFSLLSGHYQVSLYVLFALIAFIFSYSQRKLPALCFVLIGVLLSSIQLFLTLHAFLQSDRSERFTTGAIPWNYLITLFSPDFYGNPVTRNDWYGQYAEWSSYIGVIPLLLAIYAFFFLKKKIKLFFMLLAGISIMISFSSPLNNLLYHLRIPIISTSVATRMIVLFSFSLIVLGAYGLDQLLEDWNKIRFSRIVKFSIGIVVFLGFLCFFILFSGALPSEYAEIAKRNSILSSGFAILFIIFLFFGLLFRNMRVLLLIGIIFITSFDMLRFSLKWMPFDPKEYVYPSLPVIEFLQRNIRNSRVFGTFGNELATYFEIPIIEGYDAMYQKRYGEFLSAASNGTIQPLERSVARIDKHGLYTNTWINLLGVEYVLYRKSDGRNVWTFPHWEYPQYVSVYQDEKYEILRNMNSLPRAFFADSYHVVSDKHDIIKKLVDINVASTIILEEQPTVKLSQEKGQTVNIIQYTPNKIHIDVQTNSSRLLFLSDVFDSGWRAKVNGKEAKIFRTNYAFRSIIVPEGKSTVHLYYQPRLFILGCLLSGITLLFIIAESVRRFMYDRRHL